MTNKTQTAERVQYNGCELPPHLAALAEKVDKQNKAFGFTDFSGVDRNKLDDFHPLHAMVR
jgi:predicted mannosyl-3-phosphoglycerate phosphatase (HAD superfamily)